MSVHYVCVSTFAHAPVHIKWCNAAKLSLTARSLTLCPFSLLPHVLLTCCSEPETQSVLELARVFQPHVWLNIHSGMEAMFVPWDHQSKVSALACMQALLDLLFKNGHLTLLKVLSLGRAG